MLGFEGGMHHHRMSNHGRVLVPHAWEPTGEKRLLILGHPDTLELCTWEERRYPARTTKATRTPRPKAQVRTGQRRLAASHVLAEQQNSFGHEAPPIARPSEHTKACDGRPQRMARATRCCSRGKRHTFESEEIHIPAMVPFVAEEHAVVCTSEPSLPTTRDGVLPLELRLHSTEAGAEAGHWALCQPSTSAVCLLHIQKFAFHGRVPWIPACFSCMLGVHATLPTTRRKGDDETRPENEKIPLLIKVTGEQNHI